MYDLASKGGGASIVLATSNDQRHPPENMLDGSFPQEFILSFGNTADVQKVSITGYNIRHLQIEKSTSPDASSFEPVTEKDIAQTDGQLQVQDIDVRTKASHLRFVVDAGYDHFIAIYKLNVSGNA